MTRIAEQNRGFDKGAGGRCAAPFHRWRPIMKLLANPLRMSAARRARLAAGLCLAAFGTAGLAPLPAQADWHGGGRWDHGWHGGRWGWWWVDAGVWTWYANPYYWGYPYAPYAGYPAPYYYAPAPAPVYGSVPAQPQVWYYCDSARAYYPQVPSCPEPWRTVPATPAPEAAPPASR
jgi:hypothetical protein